MSMVLSQFVSPSPSPEQTLRRTGENGMLPSMGLQRVRQDLVTE